MSEPEVEGEREKGRQMTVRKTSPRCHQGTQQKMPVAPGTHHCSPTVTPPPMDESVQGQCEFFSRKCKREELQKRAHFERLNNFTQRD